jgi:hypothetical protein
MKRRKKHKPCSCGKVHLPHVVCKALFMVLAVAGGISLVRHLVLKILMNAEKSHE